MEGTKKITKNFLFNVNKFFDFCFDFKNFRFDLAKALENITISKAKDDYKGPDGFAFHSTIAFKDIDNKFDKIWNYISKKKQKKIRQTLLRVTLLKNGKILKEYDFMQKRLLNRKEALNKGLWKKTIRILKSGSNGNE